MKDKLEIQNRLPKKDYILVIGSSHSCGTCRIDSKNQTHIDYDDVWCSILAKKLNLELFNVSVEGTDNWLILNQLTDYFDLVNDTSKCKMVIAESRLFDMGNTLSRDLINDFYKNIDGIFPDIYCGWDLKEKNMLDTFYNTVFHKYMNSDHENSERMKKLILDAHPSIPNVKPAIPKQLTQTIKREIQTFQEIAATTVRNYVYDLFLIRNMAKLCELAKIPFHWFCWDKNPTDLFNGKYVDEIFHYNSNVFDYQFKSLCPNAHYVYEKENGIGSIEFCDCLHMQESFQKYVAEKIYRELNGNQR